MPPARTSAKAPARAAGAVPPNRGKPPTSGKPPGGGGGSGFGRRFGRFNAAAQRSGAGQRAGNLGTLLREVRQEIKKVDWPSREEASKLTAAVVGLSALVGVFLGGVDYLFQELFKLIIGLSNGGV